MLHISQFLEHLLQAGKALVRLFALQRPQFLLGLSSFGVNCLSAGLFILAPRYLLR